MSPFDRAEAAWESTWIDGPDYDRPDDDPADLDAYQQFPEPADAGEEQDDDIPF